MTRSIRVLILSLACVVLVLAVGLTVQSPAAAGRPLQEADLPEGVARGAQPLSTVEVLRLPTQDNQALIDEEIQRAGPGVAPAFAKPLAVDVTPATHGTWETLADGRQLWRLRVHSPGAVSLNLGFGRYWMPEGGQLILYTPDYKVVRGRFTAADNEAHGQLWTPLLEGDEVVIEVSIAADAVNRLELHLTAVNHGFTPFGRPLSGSCNVDVVCSEGDEWRDEIRSVAVISTGGSLFCTGFLVNNAAQDLTPYFMTARHCGLTAGNASSLVVYWNYENSFCRPVGDPSNGGPGDGSLDQFQTGSIWRASNSPSDFTLVELDDDPAPAFNVHWAGWDATPADSTSATAIHHPDVEEKRISFEFQPTTTTSYLGNSSPGDGTHVRVADWDVGTTEPGSSGSPLFNQLQRIVGQLHGGYAACGNDSADWYGRISVSWTGGGTPSTRLNDWLDPNNTGVLVLDGRDIIEAPDFELVASPASAAICAGTNAVYTVNVNQLNGFTDPVSLTSSGRPPGTTANFTPNPVTPPGSSAFTIGNTTGAPPGDYSILITGIAPTSTHTTTVGLNLATVVPGQPSLLTPANGAANVPVMPTFTWAAANQGSTYEIQIASDPGFTNIVDSAGGLTETSYTTDVVLSTSTSYYWRVRSTNGCGTGSFSIAFSFTTEPAPGDCSPGSTPVIVYSDDFESGAPGWTHSGSGDTWALSSQRPHSGSFAYRGRDVGSVTDQRLLSPAVTLPAGQGPLTLQFWNYQEIEANPPGCFDGAILEISTDGGATWTQIESELLTDPYDGVVSSSYSNPLAGLNAWCGDPQAYLDSIVDLDAYAGQTVSFRFRLGTDSSVSREGWYVDDVTVQACEGGSTAASARIQMAFEAFQPDQLATRILIGDPNAQSPIAGATVEVTFDLPDGPVTASAVTNGSGWASFLMPTAGGGTCTVTVDNVTAPGYTFDPGVGVTTRTINCQ